MGMETDSFMKMYRLNDKRTRQHGREDMDIDGTWVPIAGTPGDITGY
jgi:hypothetical protein